MAASKNGHDKAIALLLDRGAKINATDEVIGARPPNRLITATSRSSTRRRAVAGQARQYQRGRRGDIRTARRAAPPEPVGAGDVGGDLAGGRMFGGRRASPGRTVSGTREAARVRVG